MSENQSCPDFGSGVSVTIYFARSLISKSLPMVLQMSEKRGRLVSVSDHFLQSVTVPSFLPSAVGRVAVGDRKIVILRGQRTEGRKTEREREREIATVSCTLTYLTY